MPQCESCWAPLPDYDDYLCTACREVSDSRPVCEGCGGAVPEDDYLCMECKDERELQRNAYYGVG
jgi:predicted amidophosphoribosyltransferase